jgi:hypothetical protein
MFLELEKNRVEGNDNEKEAYSLEHGQSSVKKDYLQPTKVPKLVFTNRKLKAQLPANCYKKKKIEESASSALKVCSYKKSSCSICLDSTKKGDIYILLILH